MIAILVSIGLSVFGLTHSLYAQSNLLKRPDLLSVLQNARINAMVQDERGALWFGTEDGLLQYNGYESRFYTKGSELQAKGVTALANGKDGKLWIGFDNGAVSYYDGQSFKSFKPAAGLSGKKINAILVSRSGGVWFATDNIGIWYYDGKKTRLIDETLGSPQQNNVNGVPLRKLETYSLTEDDEGRIWAGTDVGITIINPTQNFRLKHYATLDGLPEPNITQLVTARDNKVWFVSQNGNLGVVERDSIFLKSKPEWGAIHTILPTLGGELWIGTHANGLIRYIPRTEEASFYREFNRNIHALTEDHEGTIWVGTNRGAYQYIGDRFEFFTSVTGAVSDNILSAFADSQNNIWVGTSSGAGRITQLNDGSAAYESIGLDGLKVVSIKEDYFGYIWFATLGQGVYRYHPLLRSLVNYNTNNGLRTNEIRCIATDFNGHVYLGTAGDGLTVFHLDFEGGVKQILHHDPTNGGPGEYIYHLFVDSRNHLWVSTDAQGLFRYDGLIFKRIETPDFKPKTVYSVCEDKRGHLWIATQSAGVYRFDGKGFQAFRQLEGLRELSPTFLIVDNLNYLYIGNQFGIDRMRLSNFIVSYFGEEDGLLGYDPELNAVTKDKDGRIWIGTTNGLVRLNPNSNIPREVAPILTLNRLRVVYKDMPFTPNFVFRHDQNHITFDFSAVSLFSPRKVQYKYRLLGYENDWSLETQARFVTYPNLPPGRYTFLVKATNGNGIWTKRPLYYSFEIEPPFWQRWWFYLVTMAGISGIGFTVVKWRERRIRYENKILEDRVILRTQQLARRKAELEDLYTEITEQNEQLSQAYQIIELKNNDITQSLEYAKRLQTVILPEPEAVLEAFPDSFVLYLAKDIVSGDFYWFSRLEQKAIMAAVDCTGHGVPGAFMSVVGFNQLNETVNNAKVFDADKILEELDRRVKQTLKQNLPQSVSEDGMDIALCVFDYDTNLLQFAGAHRPMYFIRNGILVETKGERFPIGGKIIQNKNFVSHSVELQKGDMIYVFSDGIVDQFDNNNKKKFSPQRLKKLLAEIYSLPVEEQKSIIYQQFLEWKGKNEQIDDVLIIGVRW